MVRIGSGAKKGELVVVDRWGTGEGKKSETT
jgi:hypothetical protein